MNNVKVTNFPGYEDFEGCVILDTPGWPFVVVGFEDDNDTHAVVVHRMYLTYL